MLWKHCLLGGGVANCLLHGGFFTQKSIWGTIYCPFYRVAGCPLYRGYACMDFIGKIIGTQRFVVYIKAAIEGCPSIKRGFTVARFLSDKWTVQTLNHFLTLTMHVYSIPLHVNKPVHCAWRYMYIRTCIYVHVQYIYMYILCVLFCG